MYQWKTTTYKQMGKEHSVCQDYVSVREDSRRVVACLCDGLGSLRNSHIAAEVTGETVLQFFGSLGSLKDIDPAKLKETLIGAIQQRLLQTAEEKQIAPSSMDCTLLFICLFKDSNTAIAGFLGDSALCVVGDRAARLFCQNTVESDGTRAVQDADAAQHLSLHFFGSMERILGFVLTSDGLENEIYYKGLDYVAKGTELYINALLADDPQAVIQNRVTDLTADSDTIFYDDISVAVISRADTPVTLPAEPTWPCVCGQENPLYESFCIGCGRDFIDLYQTVAFPGGKTKFFRQIRRSPEKKRQLLAELNKADAAAERTPLPGIGVVSAEPSQQETYGDGFTVSRTQKDAPDSVKNSPPEQRQNQSPTAAANTAKRGLARYWWLFAILALIAGIVIGASVMAVIKDIQRPGTYVVPTTAATEPARENSDSGYPYQPVQETPQEPQRSEPAPTAPYAEENTQEPYGEESQTESVSEPENPVETPTDSGTEEPSAG